MDTRTDGLTIARSIHDIPANHWQALYDPCAGGYPFLDRRFLAALEDSDCIGTQPGHPSGWEVHYLVSSGAVSGGAVSSGTVNSGAVNSGAVNSGAVNSGAVNSGAVNSGAVNSGAVNSGAVNSGAVPHTIIPCYIKTHSYGEYVFDWQWAEAYEKYGLNYYPKLLWAVPFTPATGPRLLSIKTRPGDWFDALSEHCLTQGLSGWHLNFPNPNAIAGEPVQPAPALRSGCQFHWHNRQYSSFDDYLNHFVSRKRKSLKKERQKIAGQGLTLTRKTGNDISEADIRQFFQCYLNTYRSRRSYPYLNEAFFQQLRASMAEKMLLVSASYKGSPVASALFFFDESTLYGRYWGCLDEFDALHFEACYYQGIEFCIERKLQRFDPGTQGEHKIARGFEPVSTVSLHWLAHPGFHQAVKEFVQEEAAHMQRYQQEAASLLPFHRE
ncbi:GNAT family N-acetyltransferase [Thalassolituus sp. LLYu03]|uniref:GNAT family N-acetyltransferase n=1 Tax=Thalassolituus sp. LLYu03 TaxID=3421656 RepID=UPI003D2E5503